VRNHQVELERNSNRQRQQGGKGKGRAGKSNGGACRRNAHRHVNGRHIDMSLQLGEKSETWGPADPAGCGSEVIWITRGEGQHHSDASPSGSSVSTFVISKSKTMYYWHTNPGFLGSLITERI